MARWAHSVPSRKRQDSAKRTLKDKAGQFWQSLGLLCYLLFTFIMHTIYRAYAHRHDQWGHITALAKRLALSEFEMTEAMLIASSAYRSTVSLSFRMMIDNDLPRHLSDLMLSNAVYLKSRANPWIQIIDLSKDDIGRPDTNRVSLLMFHGTKYRNIISIVAQGLQPGYKHGSIWLTNKLEIAENYTDETVLNTAYIFVVEVQMTILEYLHQEEFNEAKRVHVQTGHLGRLADDMIMTVEDASRLKLRYLIILRTRKR